MKPESIAVCLVAFALTLAWSLFAGKDVSWDVVNHHLYLPFSLLSGRYATDLFAAGPQSYQNPLGYVPGYLLVRSGLPGWAMAAELAALHALPAAWGLHRITLSIWGPERTAMRWRWLALALAWSAPVFLLLAGTTSIDPLCAGLILVAVAAVVEREARPGLLSLGGLALGLAIAIKPTSGVFALAMLPVAAQKLYGRQWRWRHVLIGFGAVFGGALAGLAHWSGWLWHSFGSPLYPLFNDWFHSPYAPRGATSAGRFAVSDGWGMLARLWEMAEFRAYTTTEGFVPDLRPLAAAGLMLLALVAALRARAWRAGPRPLAARADLQLLTLLLAAYPIWMISSGNARYLIAWFMLVGLMLARAADKALPPRAGPIFLAVLLLVQLGIYAGAGHRRFKAAPWGDAPFIEAQVPQRLQHQPYLHLSLGMQTYAAAALFLAPDGALINIAGQVAMPTEGPLGEALKARLARWQGRTRFLLGAPSDPTLQIADPQAQARARFLTYRFGLDIDWNDCERLRLETHEALSPGPDGKPPPRGMALLSCAAIPRRDRDPVIDARVAQADRVFELLETRCPHIYAPRPFASDIGPVSVQRLYANHDARVTVSPVDGVMLTHFRSLDAVFLGSINEVIANGGRDACKAWDKLSRQ